MVMLYNVYREINNNLITGGIEMNEKKVMIFKNGKVYGTFPSITLANRKLDFEERLGDRVVGNLLYRNKVGTENTNWSDNKKEKFKRWDVQFI